MKHNEMIEGNIYTNGDMKQYRQIDRIFQDDDSGKWVVIYRGIGRMIINGKVHRLATHTCLADTFAKWALFGMSEETFVDTRKVLATREAIE